MEMKSNQILALDSLHRECNYGSSN